SGKLRSFPSRRFQALWTLFSKFFSSFPRGTCSLSVSRRYLALDGIYRPFGAAIPSNPTLRDADARPRSDVCLALLGRGTGLSPSGALHSGRLVPRGNARDDASPNYNSGRTPSGPRIPNLGSSRFARRY